MDVTLPEELRMLRESVARFTLEDVPRLPRVAHLRRPQRRAPLRAGIAAQRDAGG
jgi:hypothetical protein